MVPITITIPHKLGKSEARRRLTAGFAQMRDKMGPRGLMRFEENWSGDHLAFAAHGMGQRFTGRMDVREDKVLVEIDLPDMFAALSDMIKGRVEKEGRLMLEDKTTKK